MILIGLNENQKRTEIIRYVSDFPEITNIIVFSAEQFFISLPDLPKIRQVGYKEVIMYRTFYPLLEEIDQHTLLVMNEMMRESNRSCLTYNCVAKFTNQTPHRLVFEWLPIIDEQKDIMILLDFNNSQRYKGQGLADIELNREDIRCIRRNYSITPDIVPLPPKAVEQYVKERDKLFDNIGNKDPDTIPRNLHIWTGRFKKPYIKSDVEYVARNDRFKCKNVTVYRDAQSGHNYTLIDIPLRRLDLNDFLRRTGQVQLQYLSTGLKVDDAYLMLFSQWAEKLEGIYAQTGVYGEDGR